MPAKAEVILRYGPYSAVGLAVEHRTFRLEGLQAVLAKGGHKVVLEKIEEWNVVELMVNEDVVFQCTITDLEFATLDDSISEMKAAAVAPGLAGPDQSQCPGLFQGQNKRIQREEPAGLQGALLQ
ncbi:UPF0728 protein C10orf53 homolog isoform X2 [Heterocephalus glaber]|uniref:UPF0728 protein C10orf53 homolog isoform X2 n=1 Tax=Heterocephalus glaber TaxID=10181 RepID=A0AAX6SGC9_HETGA|nr:UPF0728 protein C10orf53 homolog isoform X2 [Heterocephalus glaber]